MNKIYIDRVFKSYLLERYLSLRKENNGPPLKIHYLGKKTQFSKPQVENHWFKLILVIIKNLNIYALRITNGLCRI